MTPVRWWMTVLVVLMTAAGAPAQEPMDEAKRAEAHRTVLRRLSESGGAKTSEAGLSEAGAALVDLYLDTARNQADVRARRAPPSRMFMGTAHGLLKAEGGKLWFAACFVNAWIDRVEVPLEEVPEIVRAALDPKRFTKAAIARDGAAFDGWRLNFVAELVAGADEALASAEGWPEVRDRAADALLAALPGKGSFELFPALNCLRTIGGDRVAEALMEKAEALSDRLPGHQKMGLVRTVFHMDSAVAKKYARKALFGDDPDLAATALDALAADPDEEILGFMEKVLAPGSEASPALRRAAVSGFEKRADARARKILERLFESAADGREKYSMACAVTRAGSGKAVPYLRKKLEEFEKSGDWSHIGKINVIKRLLEEHEAREGSE